jgi:hypothetical protein
MNEVNKYHKIMAWLLIGFGALFAVEWVIGELPNFYTFFCVGVGVAANEVVHWLSDRSATPYRWKCPHCKKPTSLSTNRQDVLDMLVADHNRQFHSDVPL